jgi:hypothetical protein
MQVDERALVLGAVAVGLLVLLLRSVVGRWWRGVRARRRAHRALAGEKRAVRLLRRHGFRVLGEQVPASFVIEVDGRPHEVALRADLLVTRAGKRYVAEVKTGAQAPRPEHRATRRQLLEYRVAYAAEGVLLVDMERGAVHEVRFPALTRQTPGAGRGILLALMIAVTLGATAVALLQR